MGSMTGRAPFHSSFSTRHATGQFAAPRLGEAPSALFPSGVCRRAAPQPNFYMILDRGTSKSAQSPALRKNCWKLHCSSFIGRPCSFIKERDGGKRREGRKHPIRAIIATERTEVGQTSRSEEFVAAVEGGSELSRKLQLELDKKLDIIRGLQRQIDELYNATFSNVIIQQAEHEQAEDRVEQSVAKPDFSGLLQNLFQRKQTSTESKGQVLEEVSEQTWRELGRSDPDLMKSLLGKYLHVFGLIGSAPLLRRTSGFQIVSFEGAPFRSNSNWSISMGLSYKLFRESAISATFKVQEFSILQLLWTGRSGRPSSVKSILSS